MHAITPIGWLTLGLVGAACAAPAGSPDSDRPTFTSHIAPMLQRACVSCHNPAGAAPFSLLTYEDVRARADLIANVTSRRLMPPWLPAPGYGRFVGERRLSEEEIRTFARWSASGAPQGEPPSGSLDMMGGAVQHRGVGDPELVVEFPGMVVPPGGRESYRNLVVSNVASDTLWVESVELDPGSQRVIHHARLMVDTTDSSRRLDAEDAEPGFDGMTLHSAASNPDGAFVGWTPGKSQTPRTHDIAWPLPGGADLVLQLHIRPHISSERVRPRVGLRLAKRAPSRRTSLVMLGSESIEIPPGDSAHEVVDEFELPVAVQVLGVYPHAHYLAKRVFCYATLPGGARVWLLRIDQWNFDWQEEYRYAQPVELPAGTLLTMRYVYDNSSANPRNPNRPPRHVRYGSESTDEMADLILQVLPRDDHDRLALEARLQWNYYTKRTAAEARAQRLRGDSLAATGRLVEALAAYREALRLADDPSVMAATVDILMRQSEFAAAVAVAERTVELSGDDPLMLGMLARAYGAAGRQRAALTTARAAIAAAERRGLRTLADSLRMTWRIR